MRVASRSASGIELLGSLSDLKSLLARRDIDAGDLVSIA
jgi:hypothetical protein